jgi:hypothetical protein
MDRVKRDKRHDARRDGHVLVPGAAIGSMSLILAAGLELLGMLQHANGIFADFVSRNGAEKFSKQLPEATIWIATWIFAFGLAWAILAVPGHARRWFLWIATLFMVLAWAPVLSLAAHRPDVAAPFIATFWSGLCAIFYTSNHRMPGDESDKKIP